jgi:hypothetical protein
MIKLRRIASRINQHQMIDMGVKRIPLQPCIMVDHGTIRTKLCDEYRISQPLRRQKITWVLRKSDEKGAVICDHECVCVPTFQVGISVSLCNRALRNPP